MHEKSTTIILMFCKKMLCLKQGYVKKVSHFIKREFLKIIFLEV